jgi:hypothetical protein
MADAGPLQGLCSGGEFTFLATLVGQTENLCRSDTCRNWTDSMYMVVDCGKLVKLTKGVSLESYKCSHRCEWLLCKECGTLLAWQTQDELSQGVSMHAFDDLSKFELTNQWFIGEGLENYVLTNETKNFTGAEVFAMFAPDDDN